MKIKRIEARNFRSFDKVDINFRNLNILIGANASGKSNFIQIFQFLKDIASHGLDNAISKQGGNEYITNINIGPTEDLAIKVVTDERFVFVRKKNKAFYGIRSKEVTYDFSIGFESDGQGFEISKDELTMKCGLYELEEVDEEKGLKEKKWIKDMVIRIKNIDGNVNYEIRPKSGLPLRVSDIFPPMIRDTYPENTLLLELPFYSFVAPVAPIFNQIRLYDFDPKLAKKAIPFTVRRDLEEDGSNLAIVLKNILESQDNERKFKNLIADFLPFIENIDTEQFSCNYYIFKVCEIYSKRNYLPSSILSDGTINITSLIVALYFERMPCMIIEEPERNIHPKLISKVVEMFKETSKDRQIIVTTHNPEIVKYCEIEDMLLLSRDREGYSYLSKPSEMKEVKIFLKNEIGLDELFTQDLLGR